MIEYTAKQAPPLEEFQQRLEQRLQSMELEVNNIFYNSSFLL